VNDEDERLDDTDVLADESYNELVDEAMKLFQNMIHSGVKPNAITTSLMVDAFGHCQPPRMKEAEILVDKLTHEGLVSTQDPRVSTSMIRAYANANDMKGVRQAFERIQEPDLIAFNVYLDSCCRCGDIKLALEAQKKNLDLAKTDEYYVTPDVATYTILLSALLKVGSSTASFQAQSLYKQMKRYWGIMPDKGLVDVILTSMVSGGNSLGLNDRDIEFTLLVLRDAKQLDWPPKQFQRRERTIKAVFVGRLSESWKEDENSYGMGFGGEERVIDPLFRKKKWNKINSGFRLWGGVGSSDENKKSEENVSPEIDEFLESKNWNNMDSGFRII
jgi:hypothetical protein